MKKLLFISMASLVLGACANDTTTDEDTTSSEVAVSEVMSTESSMVEEESSTVVESEEMEADEADLEEVTDSDLESAEKVSEYAEYEELDAQDIFNPSDYEGHLVTDNQGTRIFLFRDGDNQMYKTIFVKNNNRLKVIDLQADQMVFNEQIN